MENLDKKQRLELAVNDVRGRAAALREGLMRHSMGLDAKRSNAWCEYGYPEDIAFEDLYKLYRRNGIANGIINRMVDTCWRDHPYVIQGEERDDSSKVKPWEKKAETIFNEGFWDSIKEADKRRLVGRYSGLVLQINDKASNESPEEYWSREPKKGKSLVGMIPVWANALTPATFDEDISSKRYGLPILWKYTPSGQNVSFQLIHHERVCIFGDYTIDGLALLEPAYNNFVNLEKIEGGSGEGFLKNAARQVAIEFDKEVKLSELAGAYGVTTQELQEKFNEVGMELNRGNDAVLILQGAESKVLAASIPDPTAFWQVNMYPVSATSNTPQRIAVGSLTGERASIEDRKMYESGLQSVRNGRLTRDIRSVIDRLMHLGIVAAIKNYTIIWNDLVEDSQADKLAAAKVMSEINSAQFSGDPVFDENEIRNVAGYDSKEVEHGDETDEDTTADNPDEQV